MEYFTHFARNDTGAKINMSKYLCLFCARTYSGYVYARDAVKARLVGPSVLPLFKVDILK